jgi:hypothetical protein
MMKKVLFLMLFLMISGTALVNAQIRLGAGKPPAKGTVLDLKSIPGYVGGLVLPRVEITDLNAIPSNFINYGTIDPEKLAGLLVYNTNESPGIFKSVYVWDKITWVKIN